MKIKESEMEILERYFNIVYEDEDSYEMETWTNKGVNMLIDLEKDGNSLLEQLKNYADNFDNKNLKENIIQAVNKGEQGAEELLDWCRCEFEYFQNNMYTEMEEDLNRVWDICNWYLDYTQNNKMTENKLLELIENY